MEREKIFRLADEGCVIGLTGTVDRENGIIRGVSLITSGLKARGHELHVDEKTVQQIFECARKMKKVPVKWNHKTGADAVNGYISKPAVSLDAKPGMDEPRSKCLGDWHLLKSHAQYEQALELAEKMPECIGLSAAFTGQEEVIEGKKFARCEELLSVDLVAQPAANPDGLFEFEALFGPEFLEAVDTQLKPEMSKETAVKGKGAAPAASAAAATPNKPATLDDVLAAVGQLGERIKPLEDFHKQVQEIQNQPSLEDLYNMSDAELAEYTDAQGNEISREDVIAAVSRAVENGEMDAPEGFGATATGHDDKQPATADGVQGTVVGAAAPAAAASATPAGAGGAVLAALRTQVTELERVITGEVRNRKIQLQRKQVEKVEQAFAAIETKVTELEADKEKLTGENEALRVALDTAAASAAAAGVSDDVSFFSAGEGSDEFEKKVAFLMSAEGGNKKPSEAVLLAIKENPKAHQVHLEKLGARPATKKAA